MDTKEIQRLLDYIAKSPLAEVSIETEGLKVSVKKNSAVAPTVTVAAAPAPVAAAPVAAAPAAAPAAPVEAPAADNLYTVKSPMIGTFYRSPGPDKPSFVEVGSEIKVGSTWINPSKLPRSSSGRKQRTWINASRLHWRRSFRSFRL